MSAIREKVVEPGPPGPSTAANFGLRRTPRLRLTRPNPTDLPDLCRMEADPATMATLGGTCVPTETEARLNRILLHWDTHGFGWWIVREHVTGRFLGRGGLRRVQVDGRDEVEVGYGFLAPFWGRGYATELALEAVRFGFDDLHRTSLVSFTLPDNLASRRVMEKTGLVYEYEGLWAGRPHVFYRIRRPATAGSPTHR